MSDLKELLDREARLVDAGPEALDAVLRRRDRRRRNQRITAGVVGIAVFVAAIWVVTTGLPFDQSQTEGVPGGQGTGPAETGPTATPDSGWDGNGIPPEEVALSTPVEGQLIGQFAELHVGFLYVYADGRVIWLVNALGLERPGAGGEGLRERRLTPEGVELVRSGVTQAEDLVPPSVSHGVPASAWAEAESRPYAPPRYAICLDPSRSLDLLPAPAQALLRGKEHTYKGAGPILGDPAPATECFEVSTEEARDLDQILSDAGVKRHTAADSGAVWFVLQRAGERVGIGFNPLFPDGLWHYMGG